MGGGEHTREHGPLSVLLVDHTSTVSGAEVSLLDLIKGLAGEHRVTLAAPEGPLAEAARARGAEVHTIAAVEGSLRLDPRHTPASIVAIVRAAFDLRRIARQTGADVIHANSFRAGLIASLAWPLGAPRPLVHIRDCLPDSRGTRAIEAVLSRSARRILANSEFTAGCFHGARGGATIEVVHNPVDLDRFDPDTIDRDEARAELGLTPGQTALIVLGQITPWKGQDTAIEATRILRERGQDVRLLIAGTVKFRRPLTRYDNDVYLSELHQTIRDHNLEDAVTFTGQTDDPARLFRAADCALVPSWAEPWGRVVVEAMAVKTPVIATDIGGTTELIQHRENGLLAPPHQAEDWADAIQELTDNPELRSQIVAAATQTAKRFHPGNHARDLVRIYRAAATAG